MVPPKPLNLKVILRYKRSPILSRTASTTTVPALPSLPLLNLQSMPVEPNTVSDGESSQASSLASAKSPQSEIQPDRVPGQVGASPAVKESKAHETGKHINHDFNPLPSWFPSYCLD